MFDTIVPWGTKDDIFLLFDFVHLFKGIRNNWITEKMQELEFYIDGERKIAKWSDIKALFDLELNQIVKMSKLSEISVNPKPVERQRVSTCLKVFCEQTLSALKVYPDLQNVDGTVLFLSKFIEFWKIVNVHGPYTDVRLIDPNRAVIRSIDDANLQKLIAISEFADHMAPSGSKRIKQLTRDTAYNLSHTYKGLVGLSTFLLNTNNHEYVALRNITTDPLEKQFGKLRQVSGGTYFITVQQVLEEVSIYKCKLPLQLDGGAVSSISLEPGHSCSKCGFLLSEDMCDVFDKLPELENDLSMDTKMALFHIAGYIGRKDEVSDDTFSYQEKYGNFTDDLNRGGLQIPGDSACQWIFYCYIMFHEVANAVCRTSLCNLLMSISDF